MTDGSPGLSPDRIRGCSGIEQGVNRGCPVGVYAVVVGAAGIDIGGRSRSAVIAGDSNPGTVRSSLGGVGRNIAHNMRLLGLKVELVTVLGDDTEAGIISESCRRLGIGMSASAVIPGEATPKYLFITGPDGDMALALNDMEICKKLTPGFLESRRELIRGAGLVVIDTNIPAESIKWLAENCLSPIFADPVSVTKCETLYPFLGALHTLKPNRLEAERLSGVNIDGTDGLRKAADTLLGTGLRRVFISLGAGGVFAAESGSRLLIPAYPARAVNTTGAGDALMAALVWAFFSGLSLEESGMACQAAAAITIESEAAISGNLCPSLLSRRAGFGDPPRLPR